MNQIHPRDSAYPPAKPGPLPVVLLCRSGRSSNGSPRSRLVFGRALRLNYLGDKAPVRRPALDQRLRFIHEGVRQRITAHIAHRERLPFPFEDKINAAGETSNAARRHGSADAHAVGEIGALKSLELRDRVIVSFAFAIAKPCQARQGNNNYADSDAKLCLLLHGLTPAPTKFLILSQPADSYAGRKTLISLYVGTRGGGVPGHAPAVVSPRAWRKCRTAPEKSEESRPKGWPLLRITGHPNSAFDSLAASGANESEIKTTRLGFSERRMRVKTCETRAARSDSQEAFSASLVSSGHSRTCVRKNPPL